MGCNVDLSLTLRVNTLQPRSPCALFRNQELLSPQKIVRFHHHRKMLTFSPSNGRTSNGRLLPPFLTFLLEIYFVTEENVFVRCLFLLMYTAQLRKPRQTDTADQSQSSCWGQAGGQKSYCLLVCLRGGAPGWATKQAQAAALAARTASRFQVCWFPRAV